MYPTTRYPLAGAPAAPAALASGSQQFDPNDLAGQMYTRQLNDALLQRMYDWGTELRKTSAPGMRQVGRVYQAASPFEFAAAGAQQAMGQGMMGQATTGQMQGNAAQGLDWSRLLPFMFG